MKGIFKKMISVVLAVVMLFSLSAQSVFASSVGADTLNGIKIIEQKDTDTTMYAKYYMTINGETTLYTEYGEIQKDRVVVDSVSIKVDEHMVIIPSTEQRQHFEYPITAPDSSNSISNSDNLTTRASSCQYKPHTETFSLKIHQFTLSVVKAAIITSLGLGAGDAGVVAGAMIDVVISHGGSYIPDSIYFDGKRCVSKSTGKIYYRYKGNIYMDSSKTELLAKNVSWSRRWGP